MDMEQLEDRFKGLEDVKFHDIEGLIIITSNRYNIRIS